VLSGFSPKQRAAYDAVKNERMARAMDMPDETPRRRRSCRRCRR
jgi:hypothetical protein